MIEFWKVGVPFLPGALLATMAAVFTPVPISIAWRVLAAVPAFFAALTVLGLVRNPRKQMPIRLAVQAWVYSAALVIAAGFIWGVIPP